MYSRYFFIFLLPALLLACKQHKETVSNPAGKVEDAAQVIQLDTIQVSDKPVKKVEVYKSSNPQSNDIIHTRLEVNFDWKACRMNGKASLFIKPYFYSTDKLFLNARGMEIVKLEVYEINTDGMDKRGGNQPLEHSNASLKVKNASYLYENDSIKINLGRVFNSSETYEVIIEYIAKPNELSTKGGSSAITEDKGLYFVNPQGLNKFKMPQIWTQGETQASSVWFPTIDSPNEKMTQEILMTVDDKYTTLSNGVLIRSEKLPNGMRTDHWKLHLPHSPYLAMMAVGEFKKVVDQPWKGMEVSYYVEKEYEPFAKEIFGATPEMISFFSERLGVPYVWPKYAQIVARDYVSGAMENTSATLHGDFMVYQTSREMLDGKKGESVIAHELFHQWFGDLVTAESWSNLPLNESFATYSDYLWNEYKHGREVADFHHWESKQGYLRSKKEVELIRYHYKDKEDMFDAFSYNKGAQILHMLRKAVGEDAFFASLKKYLETNQFKAAEIHHLRLAFEEVTGTDMNWFFNQWFLAQGRPNLVVTKVFNADSTKLTVTVEQKQDLEQFPLYTLPLYIDIYENRIPQRHRVEITQQKQSFAFSLAAEPNLVIFDGERQLLADVKFQKSDVEWQMQYKLSSLYEDRYDALKELSTKLTAPEVQGLFKEAAANDKFYAIRNYAIGVLKNSKLDKSDLKTLFLQIYTTDKNNSTRKEALEALNTILPGDPEIEGWNINALTEKSYAICGEALSALAKSNPTLALEKARAFERESGKAVLFPIAMLYSQHGGDSQISFFRGGLPYMNGFEQVNFCMSYVRTAKRCEIADNVIMTALDLESLSKDANRFMKSAYYKGVKDLADTWATKEKQFLKQKEDAGEAGNSVKADTELQNASKAKKELAAILERMK